MLEDGVNESLLGMLNPVIEQNKATLSVENKLEVCNYVGNMKEIGVLYIDVLYMRPKYYDNQ